MNSARHGQARLKSRATRSADLRATLKDYAPKFDLWYTLSPEMREQLEKEEKREKLKEIEDIRKVLSGLGVEEPEHLTRLLQLQIFHINFDGVKQHFDQMKKDLEQEYKLKFETVELTRKTCVYHQAELDKTLTEIKEETVKLEEAKSEKLNDVHVLLRSLIDKNMAKGEDYIKKFKEIEAKRSELDAREKQLDTLHEDTITKLEDQNFELKHEIADLKKQAALLKKKKARRPQEKQHKENMAAFARQQQTANSAAIKPKKTSTHKRSRN